jgi:class 3 adenylate cyclase
MFSNKDQTHEPLACFNPVPLGVEQSVCIFFSDINGYTPFAESLAPHDVIRMLGYYFEGMGGIVQGHGGRIIVIPSRAPARSTRGGSRRKKA